MIAAFGISKVLLFPQSTYAYGHSEALTGVLIAMSCDEKSIVLENYVRIRTIDDAVIPSLISK